MKRYAARIAGLLAVVLVALSPPLTRPARADPLAIPAAPSHAGQASSARTDAPDGASVGLAPRQLLVMLRVPPEHFRPDGSYGASYLDDAGRAARRRIAGELGRTYGLKVRDNWPMPLISVDCFLMDAVGDASLERVLDALSHDPRVVWVQRVAEYQGMSAGADPLYPVQPAAKAWHLAELHRVSTGRDVSVAIVDSGVDAAHPDLAGQIALRRNFVDDVVDVPEAHGTAVAGIIAARADNGIGIVGIAPGARLMALRACWERSGMAARCSSLTLGKAINFAIEHDAQVINLSLAGPPDRLLRSLVEAAQARGIVVVGAVDPQRADGGYPAAYPGVLAVTRSGDPRPPILAVLSAPGADVPTCLTGARWGMVTGSSYSAAHVAGLSALLAALQPRATPLALRRMLDGASASSATTAVSESPAGIDACAALSRAAGRCVCLCSLTAAIAPASR